MAIGSVSGWGAAWSTGPGLRVSSPSASAQGNADALAQSGPARVDEASAQAPGSSCGPAADQSKGTKTPGEAARAGSGLNPWQALTKEEKREVDSLKERDREVRAHEQAHVSAGGQHVRGGAQFETETGPDGRSYATGGEVSIDASPVPNDPLATIQKAQTIRKAALAPAEPSGQDRQVAAEASQMEAEARAEWTRRKQDEAERAAESIRTGATGSYPAASPFAAYTGSDRSPPPSAAGAMHLSIYV